MNSLVEPAPTKSKTAPTDLKARRKRIIKLFRWLVWDYGLERTQKSVLGKKFVEKRKADRDRARAIKFRTTATELGGVLIKLGQYLSARYDLLPDEWIEELSKLQDSVPSVPFEELRPIIEQDLGGTVEEIFGEFDTRPLASASLGQVHKARLKDGTVVAVKVLRPNISTIIQADLEAMNRVIDFLSRRTDLGKLADLKGIAKEFDRTLRRELDYRLEAESAETIRKNLQNLRYVYLPRIYADYSTARVLTTEFIDGIKINNFRALDEAGLDRLKAARVLANAYLNQILIDGYFHADPHPGNLFMRYGPDGGLQVVFIDFGMVGEIKPEVRQQLRKLVYSVANRDINAIVDALRAMNFIKKEEDVDKIRVAVSYIMDKFIGYNLGQLKEINFQKVFEELNYIIYSQPLYLPADFSFLSRAMETLIGLCTNLSPELDFVTEAKPFINRLIELETKGVFSSNGNGNGNGGLFDGGIEGFLKSPIGQQLTENALYLINLPRNLNTALEKIERGQLQVTVQDAVIEDAKLKTEGSNDKLVLGAVAAGSALLSGVAVAVGMRRGRNGNSNGHSKNGKH